MMYNPTMPDFIPDPEMYSDCLLIDKCKEVITFLQNSDNEDYAEIVEEICYRYDIVCSMIKEKANGRK